MGGGGRGKPSDGDKQGAAHVEGAKWKVGSGMNKKKKVGSAGACGWEEGREKLGGVGGDIYLSPDGSVLGVHLWRNEISG